MDMDEEELIKEPVAKHGETSCPYCGDSAVGHLSTYCHETIASAGNRALSHPFTRHLQRVADRAADVIAWAFLVLLQLLGAASFGSDIHKARSLRSRLIWQEAKRRGILVEQLLLFRRPTEWYRVRMNGAWHYFESLPLPRRFPHLWQEWLDDKHLFKERMRAARIRVPRSFAVTSARGAHEAFLRIGAPIVVKPCTGSRGRHTTVGVRTEEQLGEAFCRARQLNHFVVVEECLAGSVCRATLVAGALRGFLRADPPAVTGDGRSTVFELILEKNRTRPERVARL
ncbi:MAG: cyanophycin synthetase [Parcubacteria group bacterium Greene0416_79]|nr:MAG: cyanophycin synthetase [Parcubacteria group bacterium Greene0416_79]